MAKSPMAGVPQPLAEGLSCVLAPNPSAMTYWGTNTYLVGEDTLAVIDPGPDQPDHLDALLSAIGGRKVSHILVTHSHLDHSPLARPLAHATGAPVLAFGDSHAGRSAIMKDLSRDGALGGGEGVDAGFAPDEVIADGAEVTEDGWTLRALHTPGHFGNHLCFIWGDTAFTGDLVMGWATSLVSPPDGDLTHFMASCTRLIDTGAQRGFAGHGAPIDDLQDRIAALLTHRRTREAQITACLQGCVRTAAEITGTVYTDVAPALLPMAERNVLAHLIDLCSRQIAAPVGALSANTKFILI